jgi:hypothetical protein
MIHIVMYILDLLRYFFKKLELDLYFYRALNCREIFNALETSLHKTYRAGVLMLV